MGQKYLKGRLCQGFEDFKEAVQAAIALHFPDYELELIMRMDVSQLAYGCVIHDKSE